MKNLLFMGFQRLGESFECKGGIDAHDKRERALMGSFSLKILKTYLLFWH